MGVTGTGKSRLSDDLATHFRGEIINSDKMQVFKGLEIVTNKITHGEKQGVRHYLLGEIEPDSNFTGEDFCVKYIVYIENCLKTQCVPIIVGGSNSYIEKFMDDPVFMFKYKYNSCFIWIDVEQSVLNRELTRGLMKWSMQIQRLINEKMWPVHHIIANDVFEEDGKEAVDEAWRNTVLQPCLDIVKRFLKNDDHNISIECT
ncbi:adenylate isopentenyltransferase 3, chloroplastic-like [Solanum verrucosum]|uniref:adenylate isopentenyltransferase 3, chloroplastic-like n=1 Tax=Solanum verrucosum TaxID=315347 RepID=UPI0020D1E10C|nr:adenylate isopentenyltransferase 3, chloroplastic-like [Solanum verrucosum]